MQKLSIQRSILIVLAIILFGCSNPTPPSPNTTYSLTVKSPKDSIVKIMNIKTIYHSGIVLKPGKYHIHVSKKGYYTYHKWLDVNSDTLHKVSLQKIQIQEGKNYFQYIDQIDWSSTNEKFNLIYDYKNNLVWGLQTAYIDYLTKHFSTKPLHRAIDIQNLSRHGHYKFDTIIYTGNYKDNNSMKIYYMSKNNHKSKSEKFANLDTLKVNALTNKWRIPTKDEILKNNPFSKYQKYFQVKVDETFYFHNYHSSTLNLPVLFTDTKQTSSNSVGYALFYKNSLENNLYTKQFHKNSYDGSHLSSFESYNHMNFILPVRVPSGEYDDVIFNDALSLKEKLTLITSLLMKKETVNENNMRKKVNKMASKAMKMIYGDPKIRDIKYDSKEKVVNAILYSTSNNYFSKIKIPMSSEEAKRFQEDILHRYLQTDINFTIKDEKLVFQSLKVINKD